MVKNEKRKQNKTNELNECLSCTSGKYNGNDLAAARLTGKTFKFICIETAMDMEFDIGESKITTKEMSRWSNHCRYYEKRT